MRKLFLVIVLITLISTTIVSILSIALPLYVFRPHLDEVYTSSQKIIGLNTQQVNDYYIVLNESICRLLATYYCYHNTTRLNNIEVDVILRIQPYPPIKIGNNTTISTGPYEVTPQHPPIPAKWSNLTLAVKVIVGNHTYAKMLKPYQIYTLNLTGLDFVDRITVLVKANISNNTLIPVAYDYDISVCIKYSSVERALVNSIIAIIVSSTLLALLLVRDRKWIRIQP